MQPLWALTQWWIATGIPHTERNCFPSGHFTAWREGPFYTPAEVDLTQRFPYSPPAINIDSISCRSVSGFLFACHQCSATLCVIQKSCCLDLQFLLAAFFIFTWSLCLCGGDSCGGRHYVFRLSVCPSHSRELNISRTPAGNFLKLSINLHLNLGMNWLDFVGQKSQLEQGCKTQFHPRLHHTHHITPHQHYGCPQRDSCKYKTIDVSTCYHVT